MIVLTHVIYTTVLSYCLHIASRQVFAYESEGEDSDTEDNIIKANDHVLLTASTEEVGSVRMKTARNMCH